MLAGAALLAATPGALACGLEDPSSISLRRGALNVAFPEALHVGTAVWQAQLAGVLPRDPMLQRDDLAPEARDTLRLVKANARLRRLVGTFVAAPGGERPAVSVVLLGPVLWTRFVPGDGVVQSSFHVAGPERNDVVLVTDAAVVEAIVEGRLTLASALELRLARLYGTPEAIGYARRWLVAGT
jgi:hypothetical protein